MHFKASPERAPMPFKRLRSKAGSTAPVRAACHLAFPKYSFCPGSLTSGTSKIRYLLLDFIQSRPCESGTTNLGIGGVLSIDPITGCQLHRITGVDRSKQPVFLWNECSIYRRRLCWQNQTMDPALRTVDGESFYYVKFRIILHWSWAYQTELPVSLTMSLTNIVDFFEDHCSNGYYSFSRT